MSSPLLDPPCAYWKEDLPGPHDAPISRKCTGKQIPNHLDSTYLELPRSLSTWRGTISLATIPAIYLLLGSPGLIIDIIAFKMFSLIPPAVLIFTFLTWLVLIGLRMDLCPPRDQPIRFNRARQKIYAYNYIHCWWNPLGNWKVSHVTYDWPQVRAEKWLQRIGSVTKQGVMLSIVEPQTNKVIDRFPLTCMGSDQYAWAYICTYMQEGASALPPPGTPKDHNDLLWCEFALRLAPKVEWPLEMDQESKSAPQDETEMTTTYTLPNKP